jgi:hypothetical protein
VKIGCQNGKAGTRKAHSIADVSIAQERPIIRIGSGARRGPTAEHAEEDQRPGKIRPLMKSDPGRNDPPGRSICSIPSRKGIAATTIQSVIGSCPIRAAASVVAIVEKVLEISPSSAAARKLSQVSEGGLSRLRYADGTNGSSGTGYPLAVSKFGSARRVIRTPRAIHSRESARNSWAIRRAGSQTRQNAAGALSAASCSGF